MMDNCHASARLALEKALADKRVAPIDLPFLFLKDITGDFSDKQQIGRGGFGSVFKGVLRNGIVAVKKLHNMIEVEEKDFYREVACLIDVEHTNIVRCLGYCYETHHKLHLHEGRHVLADQRYMLFCFEFLPKGNLAKYLTGPSSGLHWELRYEIIKGICEGVGYLHQSKRITHMDLKPDNILLDNSMVPKITDFGLSRRFSGNQSKIITKSIVGTKQYMAPEFLKDGTITFKVDIYSLGIIITEIVTGCRECPNVDKVLESWANMFGTSPISSPLLEQVKLCAQIGIDCRHDDPSRRPKIADIIQRLNEMDIAVQMGSSRFFQANQQAQQRMPNSAPVTQMAAASFLPVTSAAAARTAPQLGLGTVTQGWQNGPSQLGLGAGWQNNGPSQLGLGTVTQGWQHGPSQLGLGAVTQGWQYGSPQLGLRTVTQYSSPPLGLGTVTQGQRAPQPPPLGGYQIQITDTVQVSGGGATSSTVQHDWYPGNGSTPDAGNRLGRR